MTSYKYEDFLIPPYLSIALKYLFYLGLHPLCHLSLIPLRFFNCFNKTNASILQWAQFNIFKRLSINDVKKIGRFFMLHKHVNCRGRLAQGKNRLFVNLCFKRDKINSQFKAWQQSLRNMWLNHHKTYRSGNQGFSLWVKGLRTS